ncbi:MAG: TlpA family protein disulfide reductase [Muribaculaceae bacterium]|nr:TlpA family protein disulfide reductase [Muribaculaceae bacterium]
MKKLLFWVLTAVMLPLVSCSKNEGEVTIRLPEDFRENNIVVGHLTIDNMMSANSADDLKVVYDTLEVKNGVASLKLDAAGASRYEIIPPTVMMSDPEFYALPTDNLEVTVKSFDPLDYEVKGSELMEDMTAYRKITGAIQQEYTELVTASEDVSPERAKEIMDRYDAAVKKFVADHPDSPVVAFAMTELSGDDFNELYGKMSAKAKSSILMPFAEAYNKQVQSMLSDRAAEQERKAEVASGTIVAPAFTLPDLAGKQVSLSDFRGKWVVLDFWGSWCGWCVKGFPALKEAYGKYGDKIVVIGIDCNESEADWKAGVKEHSLPWINVYNGMDRKLYEAYGIEGFPTKAIINPEGKLVDLTTGEDPSFYERLASFVK